MNIQQLKRQTLALGFETSFWDENAFLDAANRCIREVALLSPKTDFILVSHSQPANVLHGGHYDAVQQNGGSRIYTADSARAYTFWCNGTGTAYIEKCVADIWSTMSTIPLVGTGYTRYYGLVTAASDATAYRLRIECVGLVDIMRVAMYAAVRGDSADSIPDYTPFVRYDLRRLVNASAGYDSFLALRRELSCSLARLDSSDYRIIDESTIEVSSDITATLDFFYYSLPAPVTLDSQSELALRESFTPLLPLLIASYMWLEDAPERAQYYRELYDQNKRELMRKQCGGITHTKRLNGWS